MSAINYFIGHERLSAVFGEWPSFHDAEIISFSIERAFPFEPGKTLARLRIVIRRYVPDNVGSVDFHMTLKIAAVVNFAFRGACGIHLDDFNHQNVIDSIEARPTEDEQKPKLVVEIESIWGLGGSLLCEEAEVESVEELVQDGA